MTYMASCQLPSPLPEKRKFPGITQAAARRVAMLTWNVQTLKQKTWHRSKEIFQDELQETSVSFSASNWKTFLCTQSIPKWLLCWILGNQLQASIENACIGLSLSVTDCICCHPKADRRAEASSSVTQVWCTHAKGDDMCVTRKPCFCAHPLL